MRAREYITLYTHEDGQNGRVPPIHARRMLTHTHTHTPVRPSAGEKYKYNILSRPKFGGVSSSSHYACMMSDVYSASEYIIPYIYNNIIMCINRVRILIL